MKFTRVTAHFATREQAQKAMVKLKKECHGHFEHSRCIGKKVSFENDTTGLHALTKRETRLLMEESASNIQHYLNSCKGFSYSVFVKR
jgi:predicted aspartyl protease